MRTPLRPLVASAAAPPTFFFVRLLVRGENVDGGGGGRMGRARGSPSSIGAFAALHR